MRALFCGNKKKCIESPRFQQNVSFFLLFLSLAFAIWFFIQIDLAYSRHLKDGCFAKILSFLSNHNPWHISYYYAAENISSSAFSFLFSVYAILGASLTYLWNRSEVKIYGIELYKLTFRNWEILFRFILVWMFLLPFLTILFLNCKFTLTLYLLIFISYSAVLIQFVAVQKTILRKNNLKKIAGIFKKYNTVLDQEDAQELSESESVSSIQKQLYAFCQSAYDSDGKNLVSEVYLNIIKINKKKKIAEE